MANLKHHMQLRFDRKQYQCDVCEKLFNNYSVMVVHKRIHFGERPYKCLDCGDQFSCVSSLKSHYKMHKQQNDNGYAVHHYADYLATYQVYVPNLNQPEYKRRKLKNTGEFFLIELKINSNSHYKTKIVVHLQKLSFSLLLNSKTILS